MFKDGLGAGATVINPISERTLSALIANLGRYLANLARAGQARKAESRKALQGVILGTRQTKVYLRAMQAKGKRNFNKEEQLSLIWTNLSFELDKLGVKALAKRCQISGRYWADPDELSDDFLQKARVRLQDLEMEARALLAKL